MVSCLLNEFWCSSDLVVTFRLNVFAAVFSSVKHIAGLFKVVLHHIDVVFVVLRVDSWVPNEQNAELVKTLSHFLALNPYCFRQLVLIGTISCLQVHFQVNDRHVSEIVANNRTIRVEALPRFSWLLEFLRWAKFLECGLHNGVLLSL